MRINTATKNINEFHCPLTVATKDVDEFCGVYPPAKALLGCSYGTGCNGLSVSDQRLSHCPTAGTSPRPLIE